MRRAAATLAAGLSHAMAGRGEESREWLLRAAARYRESYAEAPPGSWGRPIAVLKALLLAGEDAEDAARWTLAEGADAAESPIGRYAAALAHAVLGEWEAVRILADGLRTGDGFPTDVADALAFLAAEDVVGYTAAVQEVLASFVGREGYLEDVAVVDTVLVLQAVAAGRDMAVELDSPLLPSESLGASSSPRRRGGARRP